MRYCSLQCLTIALMFLVVAGCGRRNVEPAGASDSSKAKQALTQALDAWRSGAKPDSVNGVIVADEEWAGGTQLLSYELLGDAKTHGNSIRQQATLEVRGPDGQAARKKALYQIATSPVVSISRSDALDDESSSSTSARKTRE